MALGQETFLIYVKTPAAVERDESGESEEFHFLSPSSEENYNRSPHNENHYSTSSCISSTGESLSICDPEINTSIKSNDEAFGCATAAAQVDVNYDVQNGSEDVNDDVQNGSEDVNDDVQNGSEDVNDDLQNGREDINEFSSSNHVPPEKLRAAEQVAQSLCDNLADFWTDSINDAQNGHPVSSNGDLDRNAVSCEKNKSRIALSGQIINMSRNSENLSFHGFSGKDNLSSLQENNISRKSESVDKKLSMNQSINSSFCKHKNSLLCKHYISRNVINILLCNGELEDGNLSPKEENISRYSLYEKDKPSINSVLSQEEESIHSLRNIELDDDTTKHSSERNISRNTSLNSFSSISSFSEYNDDDTDEDVGLIFKCADEVSKFRNEDCYNSFERNNDEKVDKNIKLDIDICNEKGIDEDHISPTLDYVVDIPVHDIADTNDKNLWECPKNEGEKLQIELKSCETAGNIINTHDTDMRDYKQPIVDNKEGEEEFMKENKIEGKKLTALLGLLNTGEEVARPRSRSGPGKVYSRGSSSEDERPKLKKCSSLKICRSPTGSRDKKLVKFADSFGLELNLIKTFRDDLVPQVPMSAYDDLDLSDSSPATEASPTTPTNPPPSQNTSPPKTPTTSLIPMFSQPLSSPNFSSIIQSRMICLENAYMDTDGLLKGTARVLNRHFDKSVTVRWTDDEWQSFQDMDASYVQGSSDGVTDNFRFGLDTRVRKLKLGERMEPGGVKLKLGEKLQFCLRYRTEGREFWDNNGGANYVFQVFLSHVNPMQLGGLDRTHSSNFRQNDNEWDPCNY